MKRENGKRRGGVERDVCARARAHAYRGAFTEGVRETTGKKNNQLYLTQQGRVVCVERGPSTDHRGRL